LLCRDDTTRNETAAMHHIYQMLMTDELFWRWSYILYLRLCLYLCVYESELNNSKCHFLWIMDVPELSYTKDSNINSCNFCFWALYRSRRPSEMFSSLMERRATYLRIAESWYLAKLRPRVTSSKYFASQLTGACLYLCCWCKNFWHRSFTFNSNKSPNWCNNFSVYCPEVCLEFNMFRTFFRPSSGA
jgi:hypothetical protein